MGITRSYGALPVLAGLDVTVEDGQILAVLGASGSGKTTMLRVIAGLDRADAGVVMLGDAVVDDGHVWVRPEDRHVGYVPQEGALFPHLTVAGNVGFGLHRGRARVAAVHRTLELVGLGPLARRYPHQLSGGQRQRAALARALAVNPRLVVLDEPFSSLDASLRAGLRADVARVIRRAGTTAILVTHDQDEAMSMADQVAVLDAGRFIQVGSPAELLAAPASPDIATFLESGTLVRVPVVDGRAATPWGPVAVEWVGPPGGQATVLIRPGQVRVHPAAAPGCSAAVISGHEYRGGVSLLRLSVEPDVAAPELVARSDTDPTLGRAVWSEIIGPVRGWAAEPSAPAAPAEPARAQ